jgi:hypothetical protein
LHGAVKSISIFPGQDAVTLTIRQPDYEHLILAALHGALLPHVKPFFSEGRRIHFANVFFSNNHMIPNQLVVVDLERRKSDIDFIMDTTSTFSIKKLSADSHPTALLLRIDGRTDNGITVSDGPESIELHLEREQLGLQRLLRFGDIVVLYKPWIRELVPEVLSLMYGPNTVMFRVPAAVQRTDSTSQVSQHRPNVRQDGLLFRNSAACRSVRGTVDRIVHSADSTEIVICEGSGRSVRVSVKLADCAYEMQRSLASIRRSHFLWIFGLIEQSSNVLYFTNETTLFNPALMHSIVASGIAVVRELHFLHRFNTFVARAVVIGLKCEVKNVHDLCKGIMGRNGSCCVCRGRECKVVKELVLFMAIDDGSCDGVEVAALGSKLLFWGVTVPIWEGSDEQKRGTFLRQLTGKEFVFVLSQCDDTEFCEFGIP